eukprot:355236-Chlamydomonas_euryale.AAC.2
MVVKRHDKPEQALMNTAPLCDQHGSFASSSVFTSPTPSSRLRTTLQKSWNGFEVGPCFACMPLLHAAVQTCFPANALVSTPGGPVEAESLFIGMTVDCLLPQLPAGLLPSSGQVVASDIDGMLSPGECEVYYN